jgi:hypothetical protein
MQAPCAVAMQAQHVQEEPVSIELVMRVMQGALSVDGEIRGAAEAALRTWEADASPGFLLALLRIVEQQQAVDVVSDWGPIETWRAWRWRQRRSEENVHFEWRLSLLPSWPIGCGCPA